MTLAFDIVVVGASRGGVEALRAILPALAGTSPLPLVVAQHRGKDEPELLAQHLSRATSLPVADALDKEPLVRGRVYLAPADYHLLVERGHLALSTEAPVRNARPSIDVLFESAAEAYGPGVLAVVLTGANDDGAAGLRRVKERGGFALVQDPAGAASRAMPDAAIAAAPADRVVPVAEIGAVLLELCGGYC